MRKRVFDRKNLKFSMFASFLLAACLLLSSCSGMSEAKSKVQSKLDYSKQSLWIYKNDDGGSTKKADCFVINPTVYVANGRDNNMNVNDPSMKRGFLSAVNEQKGLYSDYCAIYSPYYRQASIEVYSMSESESEKYFDIAYSDIENAFLYYMKNCNHGRPLVLAGFSQGADMCIRLLKDHGNDPAVKKALVACYAIGWRLTEDDIAKYPHLKPAQGENDTGVIICYDCEAESVKKSLVVPEGMKSFSINPLNWKTDSTPADKSLNKGSVMPDGSIKENLTGCYIDPSRGTLKVTDVSADDYKAGPSCFENGEYHIYDYMFFFQNLKENVAKRIRAK